MRLLAEPIRWLVAVVVVLSAGCLCKAQERDTQLWTEIDIELPLAKRLTALGTQEFRLYDDVTDYSLYRTELGMEYKILSFLRLTAVYRFDVKADKTEHTGLISSTVKGDAGPLELSWRLRFQRDFFPESSPEDAIRNKFSVGFADAGLVKPYIASEIYYYMNGKNIGFNRFRWYAGVKREIDEHHDVELYYMLQREIKTSKTELTTVLGLGYSYSL